MLLDAPAVAAIRTAWERMAQGTVPDLDNADFVESLFAIALLAHMEAPEQLEFLRCRGGEVHLSDSMAAQFKQMKPEQQMVLRPWTNDSELLRLAL